MSAPGESPSDICREIQNVGANVSIVGRFLIVSPANKLSEELQKKIKSHINELHEYVAATYKKVWEVILIDKHNQRISHTYSSFETAYQGFDMMKDKYKCFLKAGYLAKS